MHIYRGQVALRNSLNALNPLIIVKEFINHPSCYQAMRHHYYFYTLVLIYAFGVFCAFISGIHPASAQSPHGAYAPWLDYGDGQARALVQHHANLNAGQRGNNNTSKTIYNRDNVNASGTHYNGRNNTPHNGQDEIAPIPSSILGLQPSAKNLQGLSLPLLSSTRKPDKKPSRLEDMYAQRIIEELEQFGYDMFGTPDDSTMAILSGLQQQDKNAPYGAVDNDFVLSIGDSLEIVLTGQRQSRGTYTINNQGLIMLEDFPPIPAAGRTIGQFRLSVEAAAKNMHNTQAYISLGSVRQISVLVVGHVKKPGRQTMTVFHSILDALMRAGGVEKTGSLRQIKLVRGGRSTYIDLYALLLHGGAGMDMGLQNGDRIIIPPLGPTVAVAGEVKRPGIYEIRTTLNGMRHKPEDRSEKLSLNDMLDLGGGVLAPGQNRYLKMSLENDGRENVSDIEDVFAPAFGDGSILMVSKGLQRKSGTIELSGHTRKPGLYALETHKTLSSLLGNDTALDDDIYPLIGMIERWDESQLSHILLDFPLTLVLSGDYDRALQDGDVIHLFSKSQIKSLQTTPQDGAPALEQGSIGEDDEGIMENTVIDPAMRSYLSERSVYARGAIRGEGAYPVSVGVSLESLIAVAGGLSLEANLNNIEVTSALNGEGHHSKGRTGVTRHAYNLRETPPAEIMLAAGDAIRVNQKFHRNEDKSVLVIGEVQNPGRYDLLPGDKMSDLLERAGGLTRESYPDGAIFSRKSERMAEEKRYKSQARELKQAVAIAAQDDKAKISAAQIAEARALAGELENAQGLGRITVEADPAMLAAHPELDMLLQAGDRLYIPPRNLTVRVSGEVLSPAALQFREGKKSLDYIHEAGGFSFHADKERSFVVYPDGSAQPLQVSSWNYTPVFIPPGSTVIVPRDPKPFDFIESAKDISQILSNLALTTLFIDDVRDGD